MAMTNQMTRCTCGHPLLLHTDKACKGKHHGGTCKCKAFRQEGTATFADGLKGDSLTALLSLKKALQNKPIIMNVYGSFRTFNAVTNREAKV